MYKKYLSELTKQTQNNMKKAAQELLKDSKSCIPVVTGELAKSGKVVGDVNHIEVKFDADHALTVHENPRSKGHKFLEKTLIQNQSKYKRIIRGE